MSEGIYQADARGRSIQVKAQATARANALGEDVPGKEASEAGAECVGKREKEMGVSGPRSGVTRK